jgi:hypothetical protein
MCLWGLLDGFKLKTSEREVHSMGKRLNYLPARQSAFICPIPGNCSSSQ